MLHVTGSLNRLTHFLLLSYYADFKARVSVINCTFICFVFLSSCRTARLYQVSEVRCDVVSVLCFLTDVDLM